MVANYVDLDLHHLPVFGSGTTCRYMGIDVQCGPRGLKGAGDSLTSIPRALAYKRVNK